eukprot:3627305-Amphidinium_carterae.2
MCWEADVMHRDKCQGAENKNTNNMADHEHDMNKECRSHPNQHPRIASRYSIHVFTGGAIFLSFCNYVESTPPSFCGAPDERDSACLPP